MPEIKDGKLDLKAIGRKYLRQVKRNFSAPLLYEEIVRSKKGRIAHMGPVVIRTGSHAERPLDDQFIVRETPAGGIREVLWCHKDRKEMSWAHFESLYSRLISYLEDKDVYVQRCYAGSVPEYRMSLRIVTETAWHSLFVRNFFEPVTETGKAEADEPDFSIIHIPGFRATPSVDGTRSSAFSILNLEQKVILVAGTSYAGEILRAAFTAMNYMLPRNAVIPMRCSANVGSAGDVAVFFGRKGTGKTTLAIDPERSLVGDHALGWSEKGLFSFDRGCYAKIHQLSPEDSPHIYQSTRTFGTILENVAIDPETRHVDLNDGSLTRNTRAAFSMSCLPNPVTSRTCGHPRYFFLLTRDALGVMPALVRLSPELAIYYLLSGYTSRMTAEAKDAAETEDMFDTRFGVSALTLPPDIYADTLLEKIRKHDIRCWGLNTGWVGEPCGKGRRVGITHSRALIRAVLSGALADVRFETDPVFGFEVPEVCPGVPDALLDPRSVARDKGEYEVRANRLAAEFIREFSRTEHEIPEKIRSMLSHVISLEDSYFDPESFGFSL
ncbi:phosphoenolpyruvate carboxykinase [Desulfonema ishimotonii]|uniref:Phosphoenolpyruvate carboxykinase (ATP) n=1 Tax=Desulfonema ishimotonii TaxID=45657 RepID=A0A401FTM5_9BACT|nr:phosphoenolpyruvate carboxykinase (ATP) [Desulfonema ishimotonii]GBC60319.1 phosphoenolpyruvate carboxykinase [Desulfonema ishimotonii]